MGIVMKQRKWEYGRGFKREGKLCKGQSNEEGICQQQVFPCAGEKDGTERGSKPMWEVSSAQMRT